MISRLLRGVALQISPPLVVTEDELGRIVDGIGAAVTRDVLVASLSRSPGP